MTDNELNESNENEDLNETFEEVMNDADVVTVPIDVTLSNSGEAADAKAVGDALALKANKSELQNAISVDGQTADDQGLILLYAEHIPMSSSDNRKIPKAIQDAVASAQSDLLPVGSIYMSTSDTAPDFTGTWVEIKIKATWSDLKNGNRNYEDGVGEGTVHFWLRTA